jgi:hypothetical protein
MLSYELGDKSFAFLRAVLQTIQVFLGVTICRWVSGSRRFEKSSFVPDVSKERNALIFKIQ